MISPDKKYRDRAHNRITICTNRLILDDGPLRVAGFVHTRSGDLYRVWTLEGCYNFDGSYSAFDLVEIKPYDDWKQDDKVWARFGRKWYPRHFARVGFHGQPMVYPDGYTSFTCGPLHGGCFADEVRHYDEFSPLSEDRCD